MLKALAASVCLVALTAAADAQALQQQMSLCLAMTGAAQRLACYDAAAREAGLAPPARTASAAPPPAYAAPPPAPAPRTPAVQEFGSEQMLHPPVRPGQVNQIAAGIVKFSLNPFGKFTLALANGQVWRQLEGDDDLVKPRKTMQSVRISRGMMGSYTLQFNDSNHLYKVARAQ